MAEEMEYRNLGRSGLKVSALSYGNMTTGIKSLFGKEDPLNSEVEQANFEIIDKIVKAGINFIDTAEIYGNGISEIILGKNLKQGVWDRDDLVISTKLMPSKGGIQGLSRKRIRNGFPKSLERLQLDYVDVLFIHRIDLEVPLKETISAINEIIDNDQAFYWGTSEFTPAQISECHLICEKYGWIPPIVEQCEYNMLHRDVFERDYAPIFDQYGTGTTVWGPIAGGLLSGKYNDGKVPENARYSNQGNPVIKSHFEKNLG